MTVASSRHDRIIAWMGDASLDCLVVSGERAVTYLAGYWRYFGSPAVAVLDRDGQLTLVVGFDEAEGARALVPDAVVTAYGTRGFGLVPDPTELLVTATAEVPSVREATRLGITAELPGLPDGLAQATRAPQIDAAAALADLQLVKDAEELARIEGAYRLAWLAQDGVRDEARAGLSEIELFSAAHASAQVAAGEPIAFFGDLLTGVRSAEVCAPVRVAGATTVSAGDALVSDLVVGRRGYWGDTAETIPIDGASEVADVRSQLLIVLRDAAAKLVPGAVAADVFASMHEAILDTFPGGEFPHHGGHGVGLGSYEDPHIIGTDHSRLAAGMVIALEPGVYFPSRFGVRVERMYVVSDEGGAEIAPDAPPQ